LIFDTDRLRLDSQYRDELRHRFITDHFFAAETVGFTKFNRELHKAAVDLYFSKNPNLPIEEQDPIHNRMHLDPRFTFKTTLGRVDTLQWICAFPSQVTVLNETATQPLAAAISESLAKFFWQPKNTPPTVLQLLYPELVVEKEPGGTWNAPVRRQTSDIDKTLMFTSPQSSQSGWHPWVINPDDMVDTENSGLKATEASRQNVISTYYTNKNTLQDDGYINIRGTRYHPFDLYGDILEQIARNQGKWKTLIRSSITLKNGSRLTPGEFPAEDEMILNFPGIKNLTYDKLQEKFYEHYESFMCYRAGAKVLMADWTEKAIEDVSVGDHVIGFEKLGPRTIRFYKADVRKTFSRKAEVFEVTTECGRVTYPTIDHRFLRPPVRDKLYYSPIRVGSKLVSVYRPSAPPTPEEQRQLDWLGGILDGEGSISSTGIAISRQQNENPEVCEMIRNTLATLAIPYSTGKTHTSDRFSLKGGRSLLIRLLQHCHMAKLQRVIATLAAAKQIAESSGRRGGESGYSTVASMKSQGEQTVYDIQTSTSNFVCDGFAVHNCQQQNDPQGGSVSTFDEKMYTAALIPPEKIPATGDTMIVWRMPYGGKPYMATFAEGAAARVWNDKLFVLDCWQGIYAPSGQAERMVQAVREHEANSLVLEAMPGSEFMAAHIRNEAQKRNVSVQLRWIDFEEDDNRRFAQMRQLEPVMKAGRLMFSTAMANAAKCRKQFIHFGLVTENGIVDCISKAAEWISMSVLRAEMAQEEIDSQRARREDAQWNHIFNQTGMPYVEDEQRRIAQATYRAISEVNSFGLPPLPGGLDG
jgi:hypothetical protein